MVIGPQHELHRRRRSRNIGVALVLVGFAVLIFAMSVVKVQQGDLMEGFDHQSRTSVLPLEQPAPAEASE